MPVSHCRNGFTLIELLVVIGIIAALAGLMVPVVGMVREQANSVACMSNQRQIGLALLTYAGNNNQAIPPIQLQGNNRRASYGWDFRGPTGASNNFGGAWIGFMSPYVEDFLGTSVFMCPSWLKRKDFDLTRQNGLADLYAGSFGLNAVLWQTLLGENIIRATTADPGPDTSNGNTCDGNYSTVRLTMIKNPSNFIWMAEHWGLDANNQLQQMASTTAPWYTPAWFSGPRRTGGASDRLRLSHSGGKSAAYLFVGGNVRSMTVEQSGATPNSRPNSWNGKD